jgi:hypothetical protein
MAKKVKIINKLEFTTKRFRGEYDTHDLILLAQKDTSIDLSKFSEVWGSDKDNIDKHINSFFSYNKKSFDFLGIKVQKSDEQVIKFETSNYVGSVPLYSPSSGKPYANLIIKGRLNEDIGEILPYLVDSIQIEYEDDLILPYQSSVRPPLYFECAKFIKKYIEVKRIHWRKFNSENKIQSQPAGTTDWSRYAANSYDPHNTLRYPNHINLLTTDHSEWKQINYVLNLCFSELQSKSTPRRTRTLYASEINYLRSQLSRDSYIKTNNLRTNFADPLIVKQLKEIGNRILSSVSVEYRAWKMDFSKIYEGYVQHIMGLVASSKNARIFNNLKLNTSGDRTSWWLPYIEPDIVLVKDNLYISIDAKYKMHMMNVKSESVESLHESFRSDLHQVLAYSSFGITKNKMSMLIYPAKRFICKHQIITNTFFSVNNHIYLIGIPFGECRKEDDSDELMDLSEKIRIAADGLSYIIESIFMNKIIE